MIRTSVVNELKNLASLILEHCIDFPFMHRCHPSLSKERLKFFESTQANALIFQCSYAFIPMLSSIFQRLQGFINLVR